MSLKTNKLVLFFSFFINLLIICYSDYSYGVIGRLNIYIQILLVITTFLLVLNDEKIKFDTISLVITLIVILYIALVSYITADNEPVSLLISKNGILLWFLIGLTLSYYKLEINELKCKKSIILIVLYMIVIFLNDFSGGNFISQNYQSFGYLFCTVQLIIYLFWNKNNSKFYENLLLISMFSLSGLMLFTIGSLFGLVFSFILILLFFIEKYSIYNLKIVILSLTILMFLDLTLKENRDNFVGTRLDGAVSIIEVSSVKNRMDTYKGLAEQIDNGLIFGNFRSHIDAGNEKGEFVHSFYLSLLTDGGLLVFILFNVLIIRQFLFIKKLYKDSKLINLYILTLLLLTFSVHLTNYIFWFLSGYVCMYKQK